MSILRYFNKHQGWHDGKRTPFGGGGGSWNPADPFVGLGDTIDKNITQPIGKGLAEADKFMTNLTPYGWALPAAIVAAYFTAGGSLAFDAAEAGTAAALEAGATEAATAAGEAAFSEAVAAGASEAAATEAANAAAAEAASSYAGAATEAGASQFTPEMIEYANASSDPIGTLSNLQGLTPEEFSSISQYIGEPSAAEGFTAGQDLAQLMQSYPDLSQAQLQDILQINYGSDPMLSADAANLAKNGYDAATIDQVLGYSYSPTELAGTGIESSTLDTASSSGLSDSLKNINRARSIAKLLNQDTSKIQYKNIPTAQQWIQNAQQVALNQPAQEQFGGLYQMNKNPFTFSNPLAGALAGNKPAAGLDVSGAGGQALNTQNQTANLLRTFA
jgi:hypothetical protein